MSTPRLLSTFVRSAGLVVMITALAACGSDDDGDGDGGTGDAGGGDFTGVGDTTNGGDFTGVGETGGLTFVDFRTAVDEAAGPDAEECPDTDPAADPETNICLAQAFTNGTDARVVSTIDDLGFDPSFASAVVVRDGTVTFYNLEPGPADNGFIRVEPCLEPALSGTVDGLRREVFSCS